MKEEVVQPLKLIIYLVGIHVISVVSYEPTHLQDIFCKSDFVIMARVRKEVVGKCKCSYQIDVLERFKQSCKSEESLEKNIVVGATASNGTYCDELKMGHEYVLAGNIKNGRAHIHPDLVTIEAIELTDFQEEALRGIYAYNCRCDILAYPLKTLPKSGQKFCLWSTYNAVLYKNDCQMKYSACTYNKRRNVCSWRDDEGFLKCNGKSKLKADGIVSYLKKLNHFKRQSFVRGRKVIHESEIVEDSNEDTESKIHSEISQRMFTDTENDYIGPTGREWKY